MDAKAITAKLLEDDKDFDPKEFAMRALATLSENEQRARGKLIAEVLKLRRDREHADRWQTAWGSKTDLGVFNIVLGIIEHGND